MNKVSNKDLWERTNQVQIEIEILRRRWGGLATHCESPIYSNITRQALTWNPQGKRKRGRPKSAWRRDLEADITQTGLSWKQLDRRRWRDVVHSIMFQEEPTSGPK